MASLIAFPRASLPAADATSCDYGCSDCTESDTIAAPDDAWSGTISAGLSVRDVLLAYPKAISILHTFGIDTCCGAGASLGDAAATAGANLESVLISLNAQFGSRSVARAGSA